MKFEFVNVEVAPVLEIVRAYGLSGEQTEMMFCASGEATLYWACLTAPACLALHC